MDNERFGETDQQHTHTAMSTDLAVVAAGYGFQHVQTIRQASELEPLRMDLHALDDLLFAVVKVSPEELPRVLPPRDGAYLTHRLRATLPGTEQALEA